MYAVVDPFTLKVVQFSTFCMDQDTAQQVDTSSGTPVIATDFYICVHIEAFDESLLGQTYDPETETFSP